jgi:hypothetical protein
MAIPGEEPERCAVSGSAICSSSLPSAFDPEEQVDDAADRHHPRRRSGGKRGLPLDLHLDHRPEVPVLERVAVEDEAAGEHERGRQGGSGRPTTPPLFAGLCRNPALPLTKVVRCRSALGRGA